MTKYIRHKATNNDWFIILDILITIFSYFLAYFLTNLIDKDYFSFSGEYVKMLLLIIPTWAILLHSHNLTLIPRTRTRASIFFNLVNISFAGFALMFLYKHLFRMYDFSHYVILSFSILNLFSLYLFRMATYRIFKCFRAKGANISNVIIYADDQSDGFIENIIVHKEWGFRIMMIISDSKLIRDKYGPGIRIYPDKINVKNILDYDIIDEIIYCKSSINDTKLFNLIETCREIGVTFRLQSDLYTSSASNLQLTHFLNVPFITFYNSPKNSLALLGKAFSEFWISVGLIFLLSPVMLIIAILIKVTLNGPVIFKQGRVGLRGRKFYMYKFRSMVVNAEALQEKLVILNESDGPAFKIKNDPRITTIGRFLRKTGLDELPQLFNILKGEMSLIGPRPPLPAEVNKYERWHLRRLSVKPGITCTWQIKPDRNQIVFDEWMKLDIQYIESWTIKNDIILIFKTVKNTFRNTGL